MAIVVSRSRRRGYVSVSPRAEERAIKKVKLQGFSRMTPAKDAEELRDPEWVIGDGLEGLMNVGGPGILTGAGSIGKSMLVMQMAVCLATGQEFLGYPTRKCSVFYVNTEDSTSKFRRRLASYKGLAGGCDTSDLHYMGHDQGANEVVLVNQDGTVNEPAVTWLQKCMGDAKYPPVLILDPLSNFTQGDENDATDMTAYRKTIINMLQAVPGSTVIDVHHVPKSKNIDLQAESKVGMHVGRGSSSLTDRARQAWHLRPMNAHELVDGFGWTMDQVKEAPARERMLLIALEHTKPNEGEVMPPVFLRRSVGGILVPMGPGDVRVHKIPASELVHDPVELRAYKEFSKKLIAAVRRGNPPTTRALSKSLDLRKQFVSNPNYQGLESVTRFIDLGIEANLWACFPRKGITVL